MSIDEKAKNSQLTVIIPAYNEEETLQSFLPLAIRHCQQKGYQLIVVNDGSTDETGRLIDNFAGEGILKILHHKINRGYGGAIKTGIQAVDTEYIITLDADGQHQLSDVDRLFTCILTEDADMIVGRREGATHSQRYRNLGKTIIRIFAKMLMPIPIHDINSGMKIYRTDLARQYMQLCPNSMPYSDIITLTFINQCHSVKEIPVTVNPRIGGASTINTYTAFETIIEILNILVLFNPMRVFLPLAVIFVLGGVVWGFPIIIQGRGVSVGAMLAIMLGVISFFFGLIAEQLSQLRKSKNP